MPTKSKDTPGKEEKQDWYKKLRILAAGDIHGDTSLADFNCFWRSVFYHVYREIKTALKIFHNQRQCTSVNVPLGLLTHSTHLALPSSSTAQIGVSPVHAKS